MIPGGVVGRAASYFRGARCERRQFHGSFRRDKVQRRANRVPSGPVRLTIACARVNIRKLLPHILTAETFPDSDDFAQFAHCAGGDFAGFGSAVLEGGVDDIGVGDEVLVAFSVGFEFGTDEFEEFLFSIAPANAIGERSAHGGGFLGTGKRLVQSEYGGVVGIFGFAWWE